MLFNKKATQDDLKKVPYFEVRYAVWKYNDDLPRSLQCKTTEGRLLKCSHKRAWERAWAGISRRDRHKMFSLKQFSCKVFKEVTGLDVRKEYDEWKKRKKK